MIISVSLTKNRGAWRLRFKIIIIIIVTVCSGLFKHIDLFGSLHSAIKWTLLLFLPYRGEKRLRREFSEAAN